MTTFYNDNSRECCERLFQLIKKGALAPGKVSQSNIADVQATDIKHFNQCHFFAGIGGWPYALDRAGVPRKAEIWTGSCPCQPFSRAGKKRGTSDSRHLWPEFFRLIRESRPPIIFGEQVASKLALQWWDQVAVSLETETYAVAAASLAACAVGALHKRQRLFWVAYSFNKGRPDWLSAWKSRMDSERERKERIASTFIDSWSQLKFVRCHDGRTRPIKPGICPVVDGVSSRVERLKICQKLRGYGNAIVPQLAAKFIISSLESIDETF